MQNRTFQSSSYCNKCLRNQGNGTEICFKKYHIHFAWFIKGLAVLYQEVNRSQLCRLPAQIFKDAVIWIVNAATFEHESKVLGNAHLNADIVDK